MATHFTPGTYLAKENYCMSDQPKHPVETPRVWLRYAEGDLGVARREMESESPAYPTICFLCQAPPKNF
jgi:hypothetical protein